MALHGGAADSQGPASLVTRPSPPLRPARQRRRTGGRGFLRSRETCWPPAGGHGSARRRVGERGRGPAAATPRSLRLRPGLQISLERWLRRPGHDDVGLLLRRRESYGTLQQSGAGWNGYESQNLATLITRAHAANDRVVLTVTDFDQASLNASTSSPTAATKLSSTLSERRLRQEPRRCQPRPRRGGGRRSGGADPTSSPQCRPRCTGRTRTTR